MRTSKTLQKIRSGQVVQMCNLGHYIPAYVRHAAAFGFDCIWLDLEHRSMNTTEIQALLAFSHLADIDIMLRAPTLEKTGLYRYLEDGAAGLMIPHVSTAEKARMLVDAVKFPPIGDRGLDGAGLDSDFIHQGGPDFPELANQETFLVVQIETPQAVENAEEIASIPGVDGLFVGPGDLGLRLRIGHHEMTIDSAMEQVATACEKHGKAWGCPVSSKEDLDRRRSQGAQLLPRGGDFMALYHALKGWADEFEQT
ncbi:MAG: 4-hydroxy-2-oxovalerate aldolase [Planctomycetaceae bacterium]|nr:4-hydroxy-2-oxovalerate aldolase [Planctomycetaceae bacterium]